ATVFSGTAEQPKRDRPLGDTRPRVRTRPVVADPDRAVEEWRRRREAEARPRAAPPAPRQGTPTPPPRRGGPPGVQPGPGSGAGAPGPAGGPRARQARAAPAADAGPGREPARHPAHRRGGGLRPGRDLPPAPLDAPPVPAALGTRPRFDAADSHRDLGRV